MRDSIAVEWRDFMVIIMQSGEPISDSVINKVKDIFRVSHCPAESLKNSFEDFKWFNGKVIQFGDGENFQEYISVKTRDEILSQ